VRSPDFNSQRVTREQLLQRAGGANLSPQAQQRLQWFLFALENGNDPKAVGKQFGISESTFRRWLKRFDPNDLSTLEEQSHRPHTVRESDVEPHIIGLIKEYRTKFPLMGKEKIQLELEHTHGIRISSSTIGRVIQRERFYYADTVSHRHKLQDNETSPKHQIQVQPPNSTEEQGGGSSSKNPSPPGSLAALLLVAFAAAGWMLSVEPAYALESASFTLYESFPNDAAGQAQTSTSYRMNENDVTWYQAPLSSTSFQIVSAPPATAAGDSDVEPEPAGGAGTDSGGHRGNRTNEGEIKHPSAPKKPTLPILPKEPPRFEVPDEFEFETPGKPQVQEPEPMPIVSIPQAPKRISFGRFILRKDVQHPAATFLMFEEQPISLARQIISRMLMLLGLSVLIVSVYRLMQQMSSRGVLQFLRASRAIRHTSKTKRHRHTSIRKNILRRSRILIAFLVFALVLSASAWTLPHTLAATTAPLKHVYNGHLLSSNGTAISTAHLVRFSYWKSADYVSGDVTATGSINTGASNYAQWFEVFTVTPDSNGYFSVQLGSGTALPTIDSMPVSTLTSLFLQVEVKASGASDTSYEILDRNADDPTVDRSPVLSVPSALNADMVDRRDVGTGSGAIPFLQSGGLLGTSQVPSGTDQDRFTLDANNTGVDTVTLRFGTTLNQTLTFDIANDRFDFNDDLRIQGNLTVTGLINGINIEDLTDSATTHLKTTSGAGLTVSVAAGPYRISGSGTHFGGSGSVALRASATNYIFFTSTGLIVTPGEFPTKNSHIRLAEAVTNGSAITSLIDRRQLSSDDREQTVESNYHAEFEHVSYQGDATSNVGQLRVDHDNTNLHNFYIWTSSLSTLQDYDVILRETLSSEFVRWGTGSIVVRFRSTSASTADNQMDISVFDTNGSPVTITGDSTDFASTGWATTTLNFGGSPTWTAGQEFLIKFKLHAKDNFQMQLGSVRLKYVDLPRE